jgi:hypothetical protein
MKSSFVVSGSPKRATLIALTAVLVVSASGTPLTLTADRYFSNAFITADGSRIFVVRDSTLLAVDTANGAVLWQIPYNPEFGVTDFIVSRNGHTVVANMDEGFGVDYNMPFLVSGESGEVLLAQSAILKGPVDPGTPGGEDAEGYFPNYVTVSGNGEYFGVMLAIPFGGDRVFRVHRRDGTLLMEEPYSIDANDMAISTLGNYILAAGQVYGPDGQLRFSVLGPEPNVTTIEGEFSSDERYLAFAYVDFNRPYGQAPLPRLELWRTDGSRVWQVTLPVRDLAISADGSRVAAVGRSGLSVYDSSGTRIYYYRPPTLWADSNVQISDSGRFVLACGTNPRRILETPTVPPVPTDVTRTNLQCLLVDISTGQTLWQEDFGETGSFPDCSMSGDARRFIVRGLRFVKFYDVTDLINAALG